MVGAPPPLANKERPPVSSADFQNFNKNRSSVAAGASSREGDRRLKVGSSCSQAGYHASYEQLITYKLYPLEIQYRPRVTI